VLLSIVIERATNRELVDIIVIEAVFVSSCARLGVSGSPPKSLQHVPLTTTSKGLAAVEER
jgi:hypothetical protein